ncbi:MAG TPA: peptidase [Acidimicrobiia bacterium]|nr:peptidase [Acidimicrobiia bacterium]
MYGGVAGIAVGTGLAGLPLVLPLTGLRFGMFLVTGLALMVTGMLLLRSAWRRSQPVA